MTETSTTTNDTHGRTDIEIQAGLISHAMVSIGFHLNEHQLPAWHDLTLPGEYVAGGAIDTVALCIHGSALGPWLDTVAVDNTAVCRDVYPDQNVHRWYVRLPDSGLRVMLYQLRSKTSDPQPGDLFVEPDGGGEPTLWLRTADEDRPSQVLQQYQLPVEHRGEVWDRIVAAAVSA